MKVLFTSFLLFILLLQNYRALSQNCSEPYLNGREAESKGNLEKRLEIWQACIEEGFNPHSHKPVNPKLGFDFIELATKHKFKRFYPSASSYYLRILTPNNLKLHKNELSNELSRIEPLLDKKKAKLFNRLLNEEDPELLNQIKSFWKQRDPNPSTEFNERLIEHWERINYARSNFTRNSNTVYGTDDRGVIYVKYGDPDEVKKGIFQFDMSDAMMWVQDIYNNENFYNLPSGSIGISSRDALWIAKRARTYFPHPSYSIWIYNTRRNTGDNLIFIFGNDGNTGEFGLRNSLEELISSRAARGINSMAGVDGLTPGILFQLMFYKESSFVDPYFSDAYFALESRVMTIDGLNRNTFQSLKFSNEANLKKRHYSAPAAKTNLVSQMPGTDLRVKQYRLLDEEGKPYLATFLFPDPDHTLPLDYSRLKSNEFQLILGRKLIDKDWNTIKHQQYKLSLNPETWLSRRANKNLYVKTPHISEEIQQNYYLDLTDKLMGHSRLMGLGNTFIKQPKSLPTNSSDVVMGDLLLGYGLDKSKQPFPFTVSYNNTIPGGEELVVHFEVYNLASGNIGSGSFDLKYEVLPVDKKVDDENHLTLTLRFSSNSPTYRDNIEIETGSFRPGNYRLNLTVTDPATNKSFSRSEMFVIKKRDNLGK